MEQVLTAMDLVELFRDNPGLCVRRLVALGYDDSDELKPEHVLTGAKEDNGTVIIERADGLSFGYGGGFRFVIDLPELPAAASEPEPLQRARRGSGADVVNGLVDPLGVGFWESDRVR